MGGTRHREGRDHRGAKPDLARGIHRAVLDTGLDTALATLPSRGPAPFVADAHVDHRPGRATSHLARGPAAGVGAGWGGTPSVTPLAPVPAAPRPFLLRDGEAAVGAKARCAHAGEDIDESVRGRSSGAACADGCQLRRVKTQRARKSGR